jgi:signal peptidase
MIESAQPSSIEASPPLSSRSWAERAWLGVAVATVYALLAVLLVFVTPGLFGFSTYTGLGSSMGDTIPDGSLIVSRAVSPDTVEVGDVVVVRWPNFEYPITHRVIDIGLRGDAPVFFTQGDGNPRRDAIATVATEDVGRVIFTVPRVGTWLPYIKAVIYLLAILGASVLWRRRRQRRRLAAPPSQDRSAHA